MQKKSLSIIVVLFIYFILLLDMTASHFFLYWRFWWFDIVMHFLGGVWVTLASYYFFRISGYWENFFKRFSFFTLSLGTIISVGVLWEVFEYITKVSVRQPNYTLDTTLDILMDVLGWLVVYLFVLKIDKKNSYIAERSENVKLQ